MKIIIKGVKHIKQINQYLDLSDSGKDIDRALIDIEVEGNNIEVVEERLNENQQKFNSIKRRDVIIVSEIIDESAEHKTYSSERYEVMDIRNTMNLPNLLVRKLELESLEKTK